MRPRLLVLLAAATAFLAAPAAAGAATCTGNPSEVQPLTITVGGQLATGTFTLPSAPPRGLVVFGHGASNTVDAWRTHMAATSQRDGVITVAMNYRGMQVLGRDPERGTETARGWPAKAGSEDLVAAAQHFDRLCPGLAGIVMYGVSMGGNMSGLGVAAQAKRSDGRPLFDYWVAIEGVHSVTETYLEARTVAAIGNEGAATARDDIEAEMGGPFETAFGAYFERTNLNRVTDIAASGVRGVVLVHAYEDGTVPYNQSKEMAQRLRDVGVPTDLYSVGRKGEGEAGTTIASFGNAPTGNAGHGWEGSQTHIVTMSGFDRLNALITRGEPAPCNRDFEINDTPQTISPDPNATAAGCTPDPLPPAGSSGGCVDREPPAPTSARVARKRGRVTLSGRATDRGCGRIGHVLVAVAQRAGRSKCRFLDKGGRLGKPRPCNRPSYLRASGRESWRLRLARKVPRGRYSASAVAVDRGGRRAPAGRRATFTVT